jgi:CRISPR-associated protein Cas5d
MSDHVNRQVEFAVWGRSALFTDPITKLGGEKCSYHIPTYEALKGIVKSIYWKPTIVWTIKAVRVVNRIRTQSRGVKLLAYGGGSDLAFYSYLVDVRYQVRAEFSWNETQQGLVGDRNPIKHRAMIDRALDRGGRQDIFLGVRDCQGYVERCEFGEGAGHYDTSGEVAYGLMFHGFDYPDESGRAVLESRFFRPTMTNGVVIFPTPDECTIRRVIRPFAAKRFGLGRSVDPVDQVVLD